MIARWNATVGADDEVWHLGDFAAGASREHCRAIFDSLAGRKHLVRGNHDTRRVLELPWSAPPVESLGLTRSGSDGAEVRLFLAHYPHRSWPAVWRGARHLYGHVHGRLVDTARSCDVGVDAWDLAPASLAEVLGRQDAAPNWPEELVVTLSSPAEISAPRTGR